MTLKEPPNLTKILKIKEEEIEEGKISNLFFLETSAKKYKTKTNLSCFSLNRGDSSINEENGEADKLDRSYALEKMRWNRIGGKKGRKGEREREHELEKHEKGNKHETHGKIYFFEISSNFFQRDQSGASIEIQQDGGQPIEFLI